MTAGYNSAPAPVAERCGRCGRRSMENGRCGACGHAEELPGRSEIVAPAASALDRIARSRAELLRPFAGPDQLGSPAPVYPLRTPMAVAPRTGSKLFRCSEVRGRVLIVASAPQEPMDFDPWRWVAIPAWGLLLLAGTMAAAIMVWQAAGFLPALGFAVVSFIVVRYIFSDRLLQTWHFTAALNGRHVVEPMPVVMLRLRQGDDREIQLRLKGHLSGGSVMEGDRVRAVGRWRRGVFHVRILACERTGATVTPRQPKAFGLAMTGSGILLAVALWLYSAGVPWALDQARGAGTSLRNRIPDVPVHQNQTRYFRQ